MTDFKVTDEAAQIAFYALCERLNMTGPRDYDADMAAIKYAIEAALPVMFERCGHYTRDNNISCEKMFHDILTILKSGVPVYRIKEPK